MSTSQPIISGFYPDPSICRVGDTYYVANSSFEYRPGVPIHASKDLVEWHFAANALVNESQLADSQGTGSTGIFAPVLRHHDGEFWLVTTDVVDDDPEHVIQRAPTVDGPWSDPVRVQGATGIDPDIAWDEGVCYFTWADFASDGSHIVQARIDPLTGALTEAPRRLWSGTGAAFPEGPHLFRRGQWWYLLIAEGGTERGHCVSIARGPAPHGPFTGNPANPILTHRSTPDPVQNTGHADLVERPDGSWAMVYLGVRPRGTTPGFHVNGRETFIAGIDWVDGWPCVDESKFTITPAGTSFVEEFEDQTLHGRWVSPGVFPASFATVGQGGLTVESEADAFVGVRTRDEAWMVEATLTAELGRCALELRIDERNAYALELCGDQVEAVATLDGNRWKVAGLGASRGEAATLRIRAVSNKGGLLESGGPDRIELSAHLDNAWRVLGELDGRYLSTEVAGGFTGRVVGVAVRGGRGTLQRFSYTASE